MTLVYFLLQSIGWLLALGYGYVSFRAKTEPERILNFDRSVWWLLAIIALGVMYHPL